MKAVYDEYGYLHGNKLIDMDNTIKWNRFQKRWLTRHKNELKAQTDMPISQDEDLRFSQVVNNERVLLGEHITAKLFSDRILLKNGSKDEKSFFCNKITKIGMFRNNRLFFTYVGERYELDRPSGFSLIKYFPLWRILTDKSLV